jgi:hypothetical protein
VEFRGHTEERLLRQASVKGLRLDRDVASLRPRERDVARVEARRPRSGNRQPRRSPRTAR